ncbi:hypothetical protein E2C01_014388 [Portunus trituberculatus]|uniref:Uncharacterized protein n=1 Tax=Portunus trituberculatus TaxID=210409 RepID=A0A5B7DIN9_PORTR|nr:hypothetical protein [Portunus trituberculatus]
MEGDLLPSLVLVVVVVVVVLMAAVVPFVVDVTRSVPCTWVSESCMCCFENAQQMVFGAMQGVGGDGRFGILDEMNDGIYWRECETF